MDPRTHQHTSQQPVTHHLCCCETLAIGRQGRDRVIVSGLSTKYFMTVSTYLRLSYSVRQNTTESVKVYVSIFTRESRNCRATFTRRSSDKIARLLFVLSDWCNIPSIFRDRALRYYTFVVQDKITRASSKQRS